MKIIDFEEAKARKHSKEMAIQHIPESGNDVLELQKQYRELAQFYDRWCDEHVIGQDEEGGWIYKES